MISEIRKIAITGALGHIGSWLIHNLKEERYDEVILLDDLSSERYVSLFHLPRNINFIFYKENILDADLCSIFSGVDAVIHLAAVTDAEQSFFHKENIIIIVRYNIPNINIAVAISSSHIFILSSSCPTDIIKGSI